MQQPMQRDPCPMFLFSQIQLFISMFPDVDLKRIDDCCWTTSNACTPMVLLCHWIVMPVGEKSAVTNLPMQK